MIAVSSVCAENWAMLWRREIPRHGTKAFDLSKWVSRQRLPWEETVLKSRHNYLSRSRGWQQICCYYYYYYSSVAAFCSRRSFRFWWSGKMEALAGGNSRLDLSWWMVATGILTFLPSCLFAFCNESASVVMPCPMNELVRKYTEHYLDVLGLY